MNRQHPTGTEADWSLAEMVILSESVPAAELIQMVGLPPDRSWNRGDPQRSRGRVEPFNGITYRSHLPRSDGLSAHLDDLLARLNRTKTKKRLAALSKHLAALEGRNDAVRLWLTQLSHDTSLGFDFSPEQLDFLGDIGAWLGLSIDVYDPENAKPAPAAELVGVTGAPERLPASTG